MSDKQHIRVNEGIVLGDHTADEPGWFIINQSSEIGAGPYGSEEEAKRDTRRLRWFDPSEHSIEYGIEGDDCMFIDAETGELGEDSSDFPKPGDNIRTRKTGMEGKVKKVNGNSVLFQLVDGRMMKTSTDNVIVIEKLADGDDEIMEQNKPMTKDDFKERRKELQRIQLDPETSKCERTKTLLARQLAHVNKAGRAAGHIDEEELNEISNEVIHKWQKEKIGPQYDAAAAAGNTEEGNRLYGKIIKSTKHMGKNDEIRAARSAKQNNEKGVTEDNMSNFTVEAKPKPKPKPVVDQNFHGWTIRYRPAKSGEKTPWMVLDNKGIEKTRGESSNDREAVSDAEEWIRTGGGTRQQTSKSVTIDFNVDFAKEIDDTFYANIERDNDGTNFLIVSYEPQKGLKKSYIRTQKDKQTEGTTKLPCISLSSKEANALGLQANGRYILGARDKIDDNTVMFPLILVSTVMGKGDVMRLGKPGLTVATSRDVTEEANIETPHSNNPEDTVTVDIPLLIRIMEYAKEDAETDLDLHKATERLIELSHQGRTLTMDDYPTMIGEVEEGTMGGINRCAPATDVSYERMLDDVYDTWMGDKAKVKESYGAPLKGSYDTRLKQIMKSK